MLCQNCRTKDACVHMKRIIGGEASEVHLCTDCAAALGYADILPGFGIPVSSSAGAFFQQHANTAAARALRCEVCGFSFEDITATGKPGCPNCYRVFGDKLASSIRKLHGRAPYRGKFPDKEE